MFVFALLVALCLPAPVRAQPESYRIEVAPERMPPLDSARRGMGQRPAAADAARHRCVDLHLAQARRPPGVAPPRDRHRPARTRPNRQAVRPALFARRACRRRARLHTPALTRSRDRRRPFHGQLRRAAARHRSALEPAHHQARADVDARLSPGLCAGRLADAGAGAALRHDAHRAARAAHRNRAADREWWHGPHLAPRHRHLRRAAARVRAACTR